MDHSFHACEDSTFQTGIEYVFCKYNKVMLIEFDAVKNARNIAERNLSFELAAEFDFQSATFLVDARHDYGEVRYIAIGYLQGRLHHLCFTETADGIRVISFRKANAREATRHGKPKTPD
jgi:uncharacterized DUF497 family protein